MTITEPRVMQNDAIMELLIQATIKIKKAENIIATFIADETSHSIVQNTLNDAMSKLDKIWELAK